MNNTTGSKEMGDKAPSNALRRALAQAQVIAASVGAKQTTSAHVVCGLHSSGHDENRADQIITNYIAYSTEGQYLTKLGGEKKWDKKDGKFTDLPAISKEFQKITATAISLAHETKTIYVEEEHMLLAILKEKTEGYKSFKKCAHKQQEFTPTVEKELIVSIQKQLQDLIADGTIEIESNSLESLTINLTELAEQKILPSTIGREQQVIKIVRALNRRDFNNAILVGPSGVGKTATIYRLLQELGKSNKDQKLFVRTPEFERAHILQIKTSELLDQSNPMAPPPKVKLQFLIDTVEQLVVENKHPATSPAAIISRAQKQSNETQQPKNQANDKNEAKDQKKVFEKANKQLIQNKDINNNTPTSFILLFENIDELLEQRYELTNSVRELFAHSDIKIIGTCTEKAWKEVFEADPTISGRTQQIRLEPNTAEETLEILKEMQKQYKLWGTKIDKSAIEQCVKLTDKYLIDQFPRKAINLLDEAVAHHKIAGDPNVPIGIETVAYVLEQMTGIPTAKLLQTEVTQLLDMEKIIQTKIVGQDRAIAEIAKSIRRSKASLRQHKKPIGSFMFLGPTGVGKTELSKQLARFLFNDEREMVRFDMSEFQESHTHMRLIGAPPSYVGYDQGGELTEALKKKPYCVLLFDEIEKAAPNIFDLLLHILDEGRLTSSKGEQIDCRNAVIIMTSNIGSRQVSDNPEQDPRAIYKQEVKKKFRPEFINRIDRLITFSPLTRDSVRSIVDIKVDEINAELANRGLKIRLTDSAATTITNKGFSPEYGARPLDRALQQMLEDEIALPLLRGEFNDGDVIEVDTCDQYNDQLSFTTTKK